MTSQFSHIDYAGARCAAGAPSGAGVPLHPARHTYAPSGGTYGSPDG